MKTTPWIGVAAIASGCASTVSGVTGDAAAALDRAAIVDSALAPDSPDASGVAPDASDAAPDASDAALDAALDVHRCPPVAADDVPVADLPDAGPYVAELAIAEGAVRCALMSDATLRCESSNSFGELGLGTFGGSLHGPVTVPGLRDVEQVATSIAYAACARLRDGAVRCWGANQLEQLGAGHDADETCSFGIPCRTSPVDVGLRDVVHLAAGLLGFCAVRRDGSVWCWGHTDVLLPSGGSAVPLRTTRLDGVAKLWSTAWGWVARRTSGDFILVAPGVPGVERLPIPAEAELEDGTDNSAQALCFRLPDGTARCLGRNGYGTLGDGTSSERREPFTTPVDPGLCGVRAVVGGFTNTCALTSDRSVWCWGEAYGGALGAEPTDSCVGFGSAPAPCATRPVRVRGLDQVERLYADFHGACARRTDRTIWCWGGSSPNADGAPARVDW